MFIEKNISSGKIVYSDLLPDLEHFFTTRETVLRSSEPNLDIDKNINSVCEYLSIDKSNLVSPTQTHSSNVEFACVGRSVYPETDALILTNSLQAVYLNFADCTPVILFDKKANIAAISHAGWRGTASSIVVKTVKKMINYTNSKYTDIYVVIGPAISSCCYNVGDEVVDKIKQTVKDYSNLFEYRDNNLYLDLKMTNTKQLIELGIPIENIDVCPYCTSCRNDLFFSYRKENGTTSRHSAVIKLKN